MGGYAKPRGPWPVSQGEAGLAFLEDFVAGCNYPAPGVIQRGLLMLLSPLTVLFVAKQSLPLCAGVLVTELFLGRMTR